MERHIYTKKEEKELISLVKKLGLTKALTIFAEKYNLRRSSVYAKTQHLKKKGLLSYRSPGLCNDPKAALVLRKYIKNHPNNLQEAFRLAAKKLNTDPTYIENCWYSNRGVLGRDNSGVLFALIGAKKSNINRKLYKKVNNSDTITSQIITFVKKLFKI